MFLCVDMFDFISSMGVQIPATWQGVTQAQISPAQQLATGVAGTAIPQAAGVVAYPIQQFQVSPQVCNPDSDTQTQIPIQLQMQI